MWFHKLLIWCLLFAWAAAEVLIALANIMHAAENADENRVLITIMGVALIGVAVLTVVARFDLAAFRSRARKELLIAGIAAGVIALADLLLGEQGSTVEHSIVMAIVPACWGIALYRYYGMFPNLFRD